MAPTLDSSSLYSQGCKGREVAVASVHSYAFSVHRECIEGCLVLVWDEPWRSHSQFADAGMTEFQGCFDLCWFTHGSALCFQLDLRPWVLNCAVLKDLMHESDSQFLYPQDSDLPNE